MDNLYDELEIVPDSYGEAPKAIHKIIGIVVLMILVAGTIYSAYLAYTHFTSKARENIACYFNGVQISCNEYDNLMRERHLKYQQHLNETIFVKTKFSLND